MNIRITYKNLQSTTGIDEITHRKSEKLNKYFRGNLNLDWNFSVEKQNQIAHCHLTGDHIEFFAESSTPNLYHSIDEVIQCLEKQVRKNKERTREHFTKSVA